MRRICKRQPLFGEWAIQYPGLRSGGSYAKKEVWDCAAEGFLLDCLLVPSIFSITKLERTTVVLIELVIPAKRVATPCLSILSVRLLLASIGVLLRNGIVVRYESPAVFPAL